MTGSSIITHEERVKYRSALKQFETLIHRIDDALVGRTPLDEATSAVLVKMTGTAELSNQHIAIRKLFNELDEQYDEALRYAGQFKFSHFCEYMFRNEPPAKHHEFIIEQMERIHHGDLKRLAISAPPGSAKALKLDTPIPTPNGWKAMGTLRVGDKVFDENGLVCNVTAVSPVFRDRPVYSVTTDCGDTIVADKDHEWLVSLCGKHNVHKIKTTEYLCKKRSKRPKIVRAKALELPEIELPIDPYLLGVWLGDGTSTAVSITSGMEDNAWMRSELERLGYVTKDRSVEILFGVKGQRGAFVSLGLINDTHHNTFGRKHIPEIYMRASKEQRLSLLQGLVDTDGTVCKKRGCTTFCNTNLELALQFRELVRSLGVKAGWSEGRAMLNGTDHGPYYRISFYLKNSARLPRKRELTRDQYRTPDTYIDVEPAGIADTMCISVDSPSHLFLCGRSMTPTHNSSYASIRFAAWHLGRRPTDRWLQGAHTMTFAKDRLGKPTRALIQEARYHNIFPEMALSAASAAADYFEFAGNNKGYYKAVGVGTGVAGYRFEIGAIDDPIASREDAESPTQRRKLHEWYDDDFGTRPSNPNAPIFICNTRWHEDDLVGHELQKMAEGRGDHWEVLNLPAIALEDDLIGREPGEGLWPEHFGTDFYLSKKRTLTGRSWNSLYQGNPVDEEGGVLKKEDVSRYKNIPEDQYRNGVLVKKVVKKITLSVDCAEKITQRSDHTAATVWIETYDKKHYMIHAVRKKMEFTELVLWIDNIASTYECSSILCEDRGAGTQYIQLRKNSPSSIPVVGIATDQKSKAFRFDGVTPMFAAGQVFLPETGTDWIADVEAEIFAFPNGRTDDYVDSISQYLSKSSDATGRRGVRKVNNRVGKN